MARGKILIIEPDPPARAALRELLLDEGYDVRTVADTADIGALAGFAPDVALVDAMQLHSDALVRMLAGTARVSIVMSLGDSAGSGTEVLLKPIDMSQLFAAVDRAVGAH